MGRKAIILCLDGCGPDYLSLSNMPFLRSIAREGLFVEGGSMIPSVSNVNHVSILTGKYPREHGVTGNYYVEDGTWREVYMESPRFIKVSSLLEEAGGLGLRTLLLTSKDKLRSLLSRGASTSFSAEKPPPWARRVFGPPPSVYSMDIDLWLMKMFKEVMLRRKLDLAYVSTTDYVMHKYGPGEGESKRYLEEVDGVLADLTETLEGKGEEVLLCVTADHGMNEKRRAVNLELILRRLGVDSKMNPIIKDLYVEHHQNLGGSAYIYLRRKEDLRKALQAIMEAEGVEAASTRKQASALYHLDESRIGDLLVLGGKSYVFGSVGEDVKEVSVRSHGSLHEGRVPIIVNIPRSELHETLKENKDMAPLVLNWLRFK